MGRIAVHEFISLDGVFEDPSWTFDFGFDPEMGERIGAITDASTAILLGRRTFEMFAPAWSSRTAEDDAGAPFFNDTPKYVVGSREPTATWEPSTMLGPFDPAVIARLKDDTEGLIYVSGSGMLVRSLLKERLVDELHLFVFPVVLGQGQRLWGDADAAGTTTLALIDHAAYANGVVHVAYRPG